MIFKFKQKPVVLNAYTYRKELVDLFPIQRMQKHIPEWWRNIDGKAYHPQFGETESNTMKHCAGFMDFYKYGYTIPLWTDAKFKLGMNGRSFDALFSDEGSQGIIHQPEQRGSYLPANKYQHVKLSSPWMIDCSEEVNFAFVGNTWNIDNPDDIIVPSGVLNFKYQKSLNINMFLSYGSKEKVIELSSGTPLFNLLPMTEREIVLNVKGVSKEEFADRMGVYQHHFAFNGNYFKLRNFLKKKEQEETKSKCPFGFGK